jgi:hypothetical protein
MQLRYVIAHAVSYVRVRVAGHDGRAGRRCRRGARALHRVALDLRVLLFGVARRHHAPGNVAAEFMQGLSTQIPRLRLHPQ